MVNSSNANPTTPPNIDVNTPYTPRRPAPLFSISVNHPFATAARKFKNFLTHKQTLFSTTFSIKITPIVAIVSLFGLVGLFGGGITTAFTLGKTVEQKFLASAAKPTSGPSVKPKVIVATPAVMMVSRAGTIKATYQLMPTIPSISVTQIPKQSSTSNSEVVVVSPDVFASNPEVIPPTLTLPPPSLLTPTSKPILHYILVTRSGSINYLNSVSTVHLQNYIGLRVLITGSYDSNKNTLTIAKPEDIEVLQ